jgi:hypothetical protein
LLKSYYELSEEPYTEFHTLSSDTLNLQFTNSYASSDSMNVSIFDDSKALVNKGPLRDIKTKFINGTNIVSIDVKKLNLQPEKIYTLIVYCYKKNLYFNFKIKNRT